MKEAISWFVRRPPTNKPGGFWRPPRYLSNCISNFNRSAHPLGKLVPQMTFYHVNIVLGSLDGMIFGNMLHPANLSLQINK